MPTPISILDAATGAQLAEGELLEGESPDAAVIRIFRTSIDPSMANPCVISDMVADLAKGWAEERAHEHPGYLDITVAAGHDDNPSHRRTLLVKVG